MPKEKHKIHKGPNINQIPLNPTKSPIISLPTNILQQTWIMAFRKKLSFPQMTDGEGTP